MSSQSRISLSGLASGVNTDAVVQQLMAIERLRRVQCGVPGARRRAGAALGVRVEVDLVGILVVGDQRALDAQRVADHLRVLFHLAQHVRTDRFVACAREVANVLRPPETIGHVGPARAAAQADEQRDGDGRAAHSSMLDQTRAE